MATSKPHLAARLAWLAVLIGAAAVGVLSATAIDVVLPEPVSLALAVLLLVACLGAGSLWLRWRARRTGWVAVASELNQLVDRLVAEVSSHLGEPSYADPMLVGPCDSRLGRRFEWDGPDGHTRRLWVTVEIVRDVTYYEIWAGVPGRANVQWCCGSDLPTMDEARRVAQTAGLLPPDDIADLRAQVDALAEHYNQLRRDTCPRCAAEVCSAHQTAEGIICAVSSSTARSSQ